MKLKRNTMKETEQDYAKKSFDDVAHKYEANFYVVLKP